MDSFLTPADARDAMGTLLCTCGNPQQFYSGRFLRGFCSEACWQKEVEEEQCLLALEGELK